ncbi:MAG TPA: glycoside hydrolase family 9 protein [Phnomibacter sp.]|nr:glycoside hydrolase family 9 protein [Phnomibacter sp.]
MKQLLLFVFVGASVTATAQDKPNPIRINQLGYFPLAPKTAIVIAPVESDSFYITAINKPDTVFKGLLSKEMQSANSSLKTRVANFTYLLNSGTYQIHVGNMVSYPFSIGIDVLKPVGIASIKGYYFQRASMELQPKYAGQWARAAGTPDKAVLVHPSAAAGTRTAGSTISSPGGWYDAGDYNKYIVNSGITMGTLLSAYEDFPAYFKTIACNIPESNDVVPDILNEVLYNLRWMLTMQDPFDGGVYNKCTEPSFSEIAMPDKVSSQRWVVQKSTAATLDFAAVMAQASRILVAYQKQFPGLSDSCLTAAKNAWEWVQKNPAVEYNQTAMNNMLMKPAITTGGYGDKVFIDEWFWAACELYISTGNEDYYKFISRSINNKLTLPGWNNVFALGYYTLLRHSKKLEATHAADLANMKRKILELADAYLQAVQGNAFKTVMGQAKTDFIWGSNAVAANQGVLLLNAYSINSDRKYADAALSNMDYILGKNATGYCFVTGIGSKPTMHPHHRLSMADDVAEPVPGLLAGGPNPGKQDKCTYEFSEPETCYADVDCSYASNEIAINWNAPLVYLSNAFNALQYKLGYATPPQKKK